MSTDAFVVIEHLRGEVADISYVMLAAARDLAKSSGSKVVAVLLGRKAQELAKDLAADEVIYLDSQELADFTPDAYQAVLLSLIGEMKPRVVLFGHTSIGADVAGSVSVGLNLPLVSSCLRLTADGKFVSQICGGKILAEGELPVPTALVTLAPGGYKAEEGKAKTPPHLTEMQTPSLDPRRIRLSQYLEPEAGDVDIAKEPLLVAVGRGIQNQDNISLADELAEVLGGAVCGSRPVVDQGWLSSSRLVGKSGKHVKPRIYLALGISGAPEHVEAITGSDVIIALNTDPAAPIFGIAKYGAEADMFDVLPPLTQAIRQAKG